MDQWIEHVPATEADIGNNLIEVKIIDENHSPRSAFDGNISKNFIITENLSVLIDRGKIFGDMGEYPDAIESYYEAIRLAPQNATVWFLLGDALQGNKSYREALEAYDKATKFDPKFISAWNKKGFLLIAIGKYDDAIQAFDSAINIDSNYYLPWFNKGTVLINMGKIDNGIQCQNKAFSLFYSQISNQSPENRSQEMLNLGEINMSNPLSHHMMPI